LILIYQENDADSKEKGQNPNSKKTLNYKPTKSKVNAQPAALKAETKSEV
jgi:hypothetical protein